MPFAHKSNDWCAMTARQNKLMLNEITEVKNMKGKTSNIQEYISNLSFTLATIILEVINIYVL